MMSSVKRGEATKGYSIIHGFFNRSEGGGDLRADSLSHSVSPYMEMMIKSARAGRHKAAHKKTLKDSLKLPTCNGDSNKSNNTMISYVHVVTTPTTGARFFFHIGDGSRLDDSTTTYMGTK
uniref:PPM-type phosphatase domain-containing protein n=1 Tax=Steinernema glaseri TaxID=37863 RepID=A0A1I7XYG7_9BILA